MAQLTDRERRIQLSKAKGNIMAELGKTGVVFSSGIINREEYNNKLRGRNGIDVYDEMRRSDATVRASLNAVKLPIMAAEWSVQAASDEPADLLAAEIVEYSLFNCLEWDSFLHNALTCFDFGFSVFEQVFDLITYDGKEYVGITKMGFRKQKSIQKWETSDPEMPGITQRTADGHLAEIPWAKLSVFTYDKEGDNFEGISLLRGAYKHWYIKDRIYQIDAIAHEKQGLGTLKVKTPSNAAVEDKEEAEEIAREQRANEEGFISEPEGFEIEFMDMKASTTRDPMNSVMHHDRQIMKNVLAQFLEIGSQGSSGSLAASNDQSPLYIMALEAAAKMVASTLNATAVKNIVDLNGLTVTEYPEVKFEHIGKEAISVFATAISQLVTAKIITPDFELEKSLRSMLHMPDAPDELEDAYDMKLERAKNPPIPPANPANPAVPPETAETLASARQFHERMNKLMRIPNAKRKAS